MGVYDDLLGIKTQLDVLVSKYGPQPRSAPTVVIATTAAGALDNVRKGLYPILGTLQWDNLDFSNSLWARFIGHPALANIKVDLREILVRSQDGNIKWPTPLSGLEYAGQYDGIETQAWVDQKLVELNIKLGPSGGGQ